MPAGQISCSQAKQYWTNSADYNQKKSQALAVATVHPRGNEVRDAIGRMDDPPPVEGDTLHFSKSKD